MVLIVHTINIKVMKIHELHVNHEQQKVLSLIKIILLLTVYTVYHYWKMQRKKVCNSYFRIGVFFEEVR